MGLGGCEVQPSDNTSLPAAIVDCASGFEAAGCNPDAAVAAMDSLAETDFALVPSRTTNPMFAIIALDGAADGVRFGRANRSCASFLADTRAGPTVWATARLRPGVSSRLRNDHRIFTQFIAAASQYAIDQSGCAQ
ncbi:hypothetical protein RCCS2_02428 [Roseobacter sp. CCS2]|nr:hypothetical protein RCCS2_02428 [Roseobacter sp. CCS2]